MRRVEKEPVMIGKFRGFIYIFETSSGEDDYFRSFGYDLSDGKHSILGLNHDLENMKEQIINRINDIEL